jgi:HEAT repeat protein
MTSGSSDDPIASLLRLREDEGADQDAIVGAIKAIRNWRLDDHLPLEDPRFREAIPILREFLRDADEVTVGWACETLGWLGAREALPDLLDLLRPEAEQERRIVYRGHYFWHEARPDESAAYGLKLMGATEAIPQLLACLRSEHENGRTAALDALEGLGAASQVALQLAHEDATVRAAVEGHFRTAPYLRMAAGTLPPIPELEASLVSVLQEGAREARRAAAEVLGRVASIDAVLPLLAALKSEGEDAELDEVVRQAIQDIQARRPGAAPGQLSVSEAGRVGLAEDRGGAVSLPEEPAED